MGLIDNWRGPQAQGDNTSFSSMPINFRQKFSTSGSSATRTLAPNGVGGSVVHTPAELMANRTSSRLFAKTPGTPAVNQLGLVEPVDGLGQGVVAGIAYAAHHRTLRELFRRAAAQPRMRPACVVVLLLVQFKAEGAYMATLATAR